MRAIAEKHIKAVEGSKSLVEGGLLNRTFNIAGKIRFALIFGVLSIGMYYLLYNYAADLTSLAQSTHAATDASQKGLFFVPILIALSFSLVHGKFTSHFWEVLGIKPKNEK